MRGGGAKREGAGPREATCGSSTWGGGVRPPELAGRGGGGSCGAAAFGGGSPGGRGAAGSGMTPLSWCSPLGGEGNPPQYFGVPAAEGGPRSCSFLGGWWYGTYCPQFGDPLQRWLGVGGWLVVAGWLRLVASVPAAPCAAGDTWPRRSRVSPTSPSTCPRLSRSRVPVLLPLPRAWWWWGGGAGGNEWGGEAVTSARAGCGHSTSAGPHLCGFLPRRSSTASAL